jgi:hypothetical protein
MFMSPLGFLVDGYALVYNSLPKPPTFSSKRTTNFGRFSPLAAIRIIYGGTVTEISHMETPLRQRIAGRGYIWTRRPGETASIDASLLAVGL